MKTLSKLVRAFTFLMFLATFSSVACGGTGPQANGVCTLDLNPNLSATDLPAALDGEMAKDPCEISGTNLHPVIIRIDSGSKPAPFLRVTFRLEQDLTQQPATSQVHTYER
jgi:hypothetical protein